MTVRIDVDFNALTRDGLVRISRRRANGDFAPGDEVCLFDPADPLMTFAATVVTVDSAQRGKARVHWRQERPAAHTAQSGSASGQAG